MSVRTFKFSISLFRSNELRQRLKEVEGTQDYGMTVIDTMKKVVTVEEKLQWTNKA